MFVYKLFIIIAILFVFSSRAEVCEEWFANLKINPTDSSCLLKCSSSMTGMDTFFCTSRCTNFCKSSTKQKIISCNDIIALSWLQKFLKWPKDPYKILIAWLLAKESENKAVQLFPVVLKEDKVCTSLHNGKGDAFRHCYWTCEMAKNISSDISKDYSDYREFSSKGPCEEVEMDLHNNDIGINYGILGKNCESECLSSSDLAILKEEMCFEKQKSYSY